MIYGESYFPWHQHLAINVAIKMVIKFKPFYTSIFTELPKGGPHIQGYRIQVRVGDSVRLNCTSLKSRPAADLHFYINDRHVKVCLPYICRVYQTLKPIYKGNVKHTFNYLSVTST